MKENYSGIDIFKFLFACLIPLLHIHFGTVPAVDLIRQYISRLGVPFFFAASGFFLSHSIQTRGAARALLRHESRVGRLLLVWLLLYSPILFPAALDGFFPWQEVLFKTPAYLWYLTALLVAAIPFCLTRNRKLLWSISFLLYIAGTLISESYDWLTGGFPGYTNIFLTTRNGIFFGLPILCVGEICGHIPVSSQKKQFILLLLSTAVLFCEITFVGKNASAEADRSMYLFLPAFTYSLFRFAMNFNVPYDTSFIRGASVAIYLTQFGFIYYSARIMDFLSVSNPSWNWLTYLILIVGGCVIYRLSRGNRILKHLF